jgi:hypothetical protein
MRKRLPNYPIALPLGLESEAQMLVADLIEKLKRCNPQSQVMIDTGEGWTRADKLVIEQVAHPKPDVFILGSVGGLYLKNKPVE